MANNQDQVTAIFAALSDPTRRRILSRLSANGEGPVTELAKPFRISAPAISKHLRVLEKARLIDRRRVGRLHVIRARSVGMRKAEDWMAQYAAGLEFSFSALDKLLIDEKRKEKKDEVRRKDQR